MVIKEISYGKSRKVGLPNYSSVDVHAGITISVDSEDEIQQARDYARTYVQTTIDEELKAYIQKDVQVNTVQRG